MKIVKNINQKNIIIIHLSENNQGDSEVLTGATYLSPTASLENIRETLCLEEEIPKEAFRQESLLEKLVLTKREFRVLQELIEADGRPLSQEELCRLVWDKAVLNASIKCQLSTLIRKLRDKMDHAGFASDKLKTVHGKGYQLIKE